MKGVGSEQLSPTELRQIEFQEKTRVLKAIKGKKVTALGPGAAVEVGGRGHGVTAAKRRTRDVYREMSRAELEIIDFKSKDNGRRLNAKRESQGGEEDDEDELSDTQVDEEYRPYDETALIGKLYRQVLPEGNEDDARRNHGELLTDVYGHTENKTDVIRNMLASIYVKDPNAFGESHDEVH